MKSKANRRRISDLSLLLAEDVFDGGSTGLGETSLFVLKITCLGLTKLPFAAVHLHFDEIMNLEDELTITRIASSPPRLFWNNIFSIPKSSRLR